MKNKFLKKKLKISTNIFNFFFLNKHFFSTKNNLVKKKKLVTFSWHTDTSPLYIYHHDQHETQVILLLQCLSPRSSSSHSSSMTIVNSKILSMDGDYRSSILSSVFSHHHQVFQDQKLSMVFTNGNNSASC